MPPVPRSGYLKKKGIYHTNSIHTTSTEKPGYEIASFVPLSPVEVQISRLVMLAYVYFIYLEGEEEGKERTPKKRKMRLDPINAIKIPKSLQRLSKLSSSPP
jgi:hypothetical protein